MVNFTSFSDIQKILDFYPPPPPPYPSGIVSCAAGQVVNATVKPNAVRSEVTEFIESKGAGQAARNLQIETPGIFWP
jgi:hypothetical protein